MNRNATSIVCAVLITVVFPFVGAPALESINDLTAQEKANLDKNLRSQLKAIFFGDIHAAGTIVDDHTNALDNVSIDGHLEKGGAFRFSTNVNRSFRFDITNATSLSLHFSKEGYYEASLYFDVPGSQPDSRGIKVASNINAVVVLSAIGNPAVLDTITGYLEFGITNSCVGLQIGETRKPRYQTYRIQTPTNPSCFRTDSFYMTAIHTNGAIVATNTPGCSDVPLFAFLHVVTTNGGMVQHIPPPGASARPEVVFRAMKFAPEDGYTNILPLTVGQPLYFFFKLDAGYGKGTIPSAGGAASAGRSGPTEARAQIELYLQRDRSRNVTSPK